MTGRSTRSGGRAVIATVCGVVVAACFDPSTGPDGGSGAPGSSSDAATTALAETSASIASDTTESSSSSSAPGSDADGSSSAETGAPCRPGAPIACDEDELVECNADGTGELRTSCALGCFADELRCFDLDPSNGLGEYLDVADAEPELDLGVQAAIDTTRGTVTVDGAPVPVTSFLHDAAPPIRVLVVGGLVAQDVVVTGEPALAIVSDGDVAIDGHFSLSTTSSTPGPGALDADGCQGGDQVVDGDDGNTAASGAGGGGFGSSGGNGGSAFAQSASATGGAGGGTTGSVTLIPLRGGCNAGVVGAGLRGAGGGALQLVTRTSIDVAGIISANGSSKSGGGSGGGILFEAPLVEITGNVVANGGAGAGGGFIPAEGEDGRTDAQPAEGGPSNDVNLGVGGDGAAGNTAATAGASENHMSGLSTDLNFAGHGGGGVGRIRVNTASDGFVDSGLFSPSPTSGPVAVR
jgi:hypothetical protein